MFAKVMGVVDGRGADKVLASVVYGTLAMSLVQMVVRIVVGG